MFALGVEAGPSIDLSTYLLGQSVVSASQLTAHYVNEHFDQAADKLVVNRTLFSGGSGILIEWSPKPQVALLAAYVTSVFSILASGFLFRVSPPAAGLGLAALAVAWAYSAPPIRLLGSGWGELVTSIVVTVVVPSMGIALAGGTINAEIGSTLAVLLTFHIAMILVFELPDLETDRLAGKRVLAVRIGEKRSVQLVYLILVVSVAGFLVLPLGGLETPAWSQAAVLAAAGLLSWLLLRRQYQLSTGVAVLVFVLSGIGALLAF